MSTPGGNLAEHFCKIDENINCVPKHKAIMVVDGSKWVWECQSTIEINLRPP
ncbi:hypothetical protein SPLC1_S350040 [Arthrospira platensis C1]|nr:hypothetical protein SPLC1_S350040 [Arthrospira platensis C1]